ncbi:transposase [Streptosporangium sp. NPDC050855]|uniref:transposase n=1 Tax=Streptosporangium sp. NPDC050855 TaxID=3366194 RepID=UPI0037AB28B7
MEDRLRRDDLTDDEWESLAPLLPAHARQGNRWADHRTIIDGVFFRTRTGCSWRSLPETYGKWKTVYNRHRRWTLDGTWETILKVLHPGGGSAGSVGGVPAARTGRRSVPPEDIRPWATFEVPNR